jgi:DEAD/DEAH box helicase domain-containing protein
MSVPALLSRWRSDPTVAENVVEWRILPPRAARSRPLPHNLHPSLKEALSQNKVSSIYIHQESVWHKVQQGENVVVVTGTASGKSLGYNLPVIDRLLRDPHARALYIFPTKALAQDQMAGLKQISQILDEYITSTPTSESQPIAPGVYDGDTPSSHRGAIRSKSRVVVSNPDMLHAGVLAHHTAWAEFFQNLRFVIIDEMHIYRGVFGSHVANVIRRLKRVAHFYGSHPQFILTSATIANPAQLAEWLVEEPVSLVDEDGSARGEQNFLIYNPPIINQELGLRRSVLQESVRLADDLLDYGIQTIIFGRTRRTVEIILSYLREKAENRPPGVSNFSFEALREAFTDSLPQDQDPIHAIRGYRGGYLPRQRREIERGLKQGTVRAVVATNALEVGIDIGGMGAAVIAGYPGAISSTWQQAGRAGRGEETSLAILITSASPLDQYLAHHPDYFFGRTPEQALINPNNLLILLGHLRCAAFELPFNEGEAFGKLNREDLVEFLEYLAAEGVLHHSGNRFFWMSDSYPAESVSLRSASPEPVLLQAPYAEGMVTIGQVEISDATWMVHPGAIYMHEAASYLVDDLDLETRLARLRPADSDYYTEPRSEVNVQLLNKKEDREIAAGLKAYGEISVTTQVTGFRKIKLHTHETLGIGEVALPPTELITEGYWVSISEETIRRLDELGLWTNASLDYGPNWKKQREQARARDGYRCQVCGVSEQGREHDVHHKTPLRFYLREAGGRPIYEQANHLSNLITLCPPCHHRAETAVRVRSSLAGLAYALWNLAPLFLMCDTRDLGVHSDPKSTLSDGSPTVVLFDKAPAGLGFSRSLYDLHPELIEKTHELVSACACTEGCPSCVGPGGENGLGGKQETLAILEFLNR